MITSKIRRLPFPGLFRVLVLGLALLSAASPVLASVTLSPTIVVIEGRQRYGGITIINTDTKQNTYEAGWRFFKMSETTGRYEVVDKSTTEFDLTKHIVMTPRRVTIGPKGAQKVKLGLRLQGEPPPPGDYRAHLEVVQVDSDPSPSKRDPNAKPKGPVVEMKIKVAFSVPVVYRVGQSDASVSIGDVKTQIAQNGKIEVVVPIAKSQSPYGVHGRLLIYYGGKQVGEVHNANIFAEISNRTFTTGLNVDRLDGGSLKIVYRDIDSKKDTVYAEKDVPAGTIQARAP